MAESALTRLIQGIYDHEPAQARRILRRRIRLTATEPSEMCWGMLRVAAKRMDYAVRAEECPPSPGQRLVEVEPHPREAGLSAGVDAARALADPMQLARDIASGIAPGAARHSSSRQVAAVLVSPEGRLLQWAVNSNARNRTLHAEVNLCQAWRRKLPRGTRIHTTLKPCKMCAGMIWSLAEDPLSIRVYFDRDDPGPMASRTVLSRGSFERERAVRALGASGVELRELLGKELELGPGGVATGS